MPTVEEIVVELTLDDGKYKARIQGAGAEAKDFARRIAQIDSSVQRTERHLRGFTSTLRDWTLIVGQARNALNQVAFLTTDWMRSIIKANAEVERLTFLMKGLSSAADEAGRLQEATDSLKGLFGLAKTAPFEINALADSFVKMKSVGIDPMAGSLQSLVDAVATFGGSNEVFKRASIAIQQMAGKGVISMEELRQQLGEAVPQAIELMARGLGVSYAELVKEVSKGTVAARPALAAMFAEFERTFGGNARKMMESFNGQWSKLLTNLTLLRTQSAGMKAFFDAVKDALVQFNAFLESPQGAQFANELGQALAWMTQNAVKAIETLYAFRDTIIEVGQAVVVAFGARAAFSAMQRFTQVIVAQRAAFGTLAVATNDVAAKIARANGAVDSGTGALTRLGAASRNAAGALRVIAGATLATLGPLGIMTAAVWGAIAAYDALWGAQNRAIARAAEDDPITSKEDMRERAQALKDELDRLEALKRLKQAAEQDGTFFEGALDSTLGAVKSLVGQEQLNTVEQIDAAIAKTIETVGKLSVQADRFKREQSESIAGRLFSDAQAEAQQFNVAYATALNKMRDEVEAGSDESNKRILQAQRERLEGQIGSYQAFIDKQSELLEKGLAQDAGASKLAIAQAQEQVDQLGQALEALKGVKLGTIPTISGVDKDGESSDAIVSKILTAYKTFKKTSLDIQLEADELARQLEDPLAFRLPNAVDDLRVRLESTLEPLRQVAATSPQAAEALRRLTEETEALVTRLSENEVGKIQVAMRERTKEIRRSLMGENAARESAHADEIGRLARMQEHLRERGLLRVEMEADILEQIRLLNERHELDQLGRLGDFLEEFKNVGARMNDFWGSTFDDLSDKLADFVMDGKFKLSEFADTILRTLLQIQIKAGLSGLLDIGGGSGLFDAILGGLSGIGSALFGGGGAAVSPAAGARAAANHNGGIVGREASFSRMVPQAVFAGAPRLHTGGIAGDEVPTILKKGEGVFTPEQMRALGAAASGGAQPRVQVNVINNTDREVEAEQGQPRFDGEALILDVVLRAAARAGGFRDGLKGALR